MKFFLNKYFANFTNALLDLDLTNIERAVEVIDNTRKKKRKDVYSWCWRKCR